MFLPNDLTTTEEVLAASVTRQLLAHRRPASPAEEKAVRHEADQVAAEMILAARAETTRGAAEDENLPETAYHGWLRDLRDLERRLQEEEAAEIEAARLR
jgi:hypothetical protein